MHRVLQQRRVESLLRLLLPPLLHPVLHLRVQRALALVDALGKHPGHHDAHKRQKRQAVHAQAVVQREGSGLLDAPREQDRDQRGTLQLIGTSCTYDEAHEPGEDLAEAVGLGAELLEAAVGDQHEDGSAVKECFWGLKGL